MKKSNFHSHIILGAHKECFPSQWLCTEGLRGMAFDREGLRGMEFDSGGETCLFGSLSSL